MNIYRIVQEAVNNAMKYADATKIVVSAKKQNNSILFSVTDNGIGFNETDVVLGNGLNNMKKRAHDIGARFSINTKEKIGTEILLSL
jgi:signal transduction histidine kinase